MSNPDYANSWCAVLPSFEIALVMQRIFLNCDIGCRWLPYLFFINCWYQIKTIVFVRGIFRKLNLLLAPCCCRLHLRGKNGVMFSAKSYPCKWWLSGFSVVMVTHQIRWWTLFCGKVVKPNCVLVWMTVNSLKNPVPCHRRFESVPRVAVFPSHLKLIYLNHLQ